MQRNDPGLKRILDEYKHVGFVCVHAMPNEINYIYSDGVKDLESKEPIDENKIFRIASISKSICALAVMKLYEDGLLDYKEDISKYLGYKVRNPYFPDDKITLEMLMTQTSSIYDGGEDNNGGYDFVNGPLMEVSLERLLTDPSYEYYTPKTFMNKKPGSYWCYSNFGCGIVACIIEKVTNKYFSDYIREVLFTPLNIDASYRPSDIVEKDNIVSLYLYDEKSDSFNLLRNKDLFINNFFPKYALGNNFRGPAGGLFISPKNLSRIMQMMMNKGTIDGFRYLKEETIEEMERIHWQGESDDPEYKKKGLQLLLLDGFSKDELKGHFGYAYGLRSFMLYNRHDGYVFMCNGANYKENPEHMTHMQEEVLKYLINKFEN